MYERFIAYLDGNGIDYAKLALAFMGAMLGAYMRRTKKRLVDWLVAIAFGTIVAYLAGEEMARWLANDDFGYAAVFLLATIAREVMEVVLSTLRYYISNPEKVLSSIGWRRGDKK